MRRSISYYNEFDPKAADWLRMLILEGLIAPGDVDERSIEDVRPSDLEGYTQCHFFAGIGGWSYALRLAGWPDDRPVWTGSCPCQPFSAAGRGRGADDARHLWPAFRWLIDQCRPPVVFGEQVASKLGREWLTGVRTDLEALGYGVGAADLCAAGVGAPHIRQRLWWVADSQEGRRGEVDPVAGRRDEGGAEEGRQRPEHGGGVGGVADAGCLERKRRASEQRSRCEDSPERNEEGAHDQRSRADGWLADADTSGQREQRRSGLLDGERPAFRHDAVGRSELRRLPDSGSERPQGRGEDRAASWAVEGSTVWLPCADGKARRIEPGLEPLVDGLPGRVGLLRGYGNAIVPQVAAAFVRAYLEV